MRAHAFILLAVILSPGCSTVNESFSCNKTAGDSCLTMDEVNAMTEEKGLYVRKPVFQTGTQAHRARNTPEGLWIAEQGNQGARHA